LRERELNVERVPLRGGVVGRDVAGLVGRARDAALGRDERGFGRRGDLGDGRDDKVSGLSLRIGGRERESSAINRRSTRFVETETESETIERRTRRVLDVGENGELRTGRFDFSRERKGENISARGVSKSTTGKDEVALREAFQDPTLDVLAALVGVPTIPRGVRDAALKDVTLVEV
jgi:hypothetical protein